MTRVINCPHLEDKHYARGMCNKCYLELPDVKARKAELGAIRKGRGIIWD